MRKSKMVGFMPCNHCDQIGYIYVGNRDINLSQVFAVVSKTGALRVLGRILADAEVSVTYGPLVSEIIARSRLPEEDPDIWINCQIRQDHKDSSMVMGDILAQTVSQACYVRDIQQTARWN